MRASSSAARMCSPSGRSCCWQQVLPVCAMSGEPTFALYDRRMIVNCNMTDGLLREADCCAMCTHTGAAVCGTPNATCSYISAYQPS